MRKENQLKKLIKKATGVYVYVISGGNARWVNVEKANIDIFNTDGSYIDWIIEKNIYKMDYTGKNLFIGTYLNPFILV
jgi:2-keto-3-deoxy-galactonokinase|tara:strand:- start:594 stop:827 length:234 start_codon:yes stop_codon:yes gene_type:complete